MHPKSLFLGARNYLNIKSMPKGGMKSQNTNPAEEKKDFQ